jgi:hypothetical protein
MILEQVVTNIGEKILSTPGKMLLVSWVTLLSVCGNLPAESDAANGITVTVAPSSLEYQYYDPAERPTKIPVGMKALTEPNWKFSSHFNWVHYDDQPSIYRFQIKSAACDLALPVIITLPKDAPEHLKAHEQGHLKINEYFYTNYAEGAIKKAAGLLVGKELEIKADSYEEAKKQVVQQTVIEVGKVYRMQTSSLAEKANVYYDELTDHGRKTEVDSITASTQAIKQAEQSQTQSAASGQEPSTQESGKDPASAP